MPNANSDLTHSPRCPKCSATDAQLVVHSDTILTLRCTGCTHAWSVEIAAITPAARQHLGLVPPIRGTAA